MLKISNTSKRIKAKLPPFSKGNNSGYFNKMSSAKIHVVYKFVIQSLTLRSEVGIMA